MKFVGHMAKTNIKLVFSTNVLMLCCGVVTTLRTGRLGLVARRPDGSADVVNDLLMATESVYRRLIASGQRNGLSAFQHSSQCRESSLWWSACCLGLANC